MALYGIKLLLLQSYKFNQIKKDKIMSIKVVQFLHSGKEYKQSEFIKEGENTIKPWNYGSHRRKFLHAKGAYIDNNETTQKEKEGKDIYFWGEWEPKSKVIKIFNHSLGDYPHSIHEPFVEIDKSGKLNVPGPVTQKDKDGSIKKNEDGSIIQFIATNTDPFVFGKNGFYYSCCKQNRKYKDKIYSTQMQDLEPGSIILFGSNINHYRKSNSNINQEKEPKPYFALDTVFVVGEDKKTYSIDSYSEDLKSFPPEHYCEIMNFKGWKDSLNSTSNEIKLAGCNGSICTSNKKEAEGCENGFDFTCYRGASFDYRVNGMYSFVPCKIGDDGKKGFERVKLSDEEFSFITNNQCQGVNITESNIDDNLNIWKKLRKIIDEQGFKEAVRLDYKGEGE